MAVEKMKELYPVGMTVQDFIIRNRDNPYGRELVVKVPEKQYHCRVEMDNALPFGIFEDLSEQRFIFLYAAFRKKIRPSIYILLDLFIGYV